MKIYVVLMNRQQREERKKKVTKQNIFLFQFFPLHFGWETSCQDNFLRIWKISILDGKTFQTKKFFFSCTQYEENKLKNLSI